MFSAYIYMLIILGLEPEPSKGILRIFDWIYGAVLLHIGLRIAAIISLLFVLLDIFYLKKKLKNNSRKTVIRFLIILFIAAVVGTIHYVLEKVIDVI